MNRGKQFEDVIKKAFERVPDTNVIRLHDQTSGYLGSKNVCDFIVYHKPYQYLIECKTTHGNRLPFSNITDNQYTKMLEANELKGVHAGIICWWVEKDVTLFIPIIEIKMAKHLHKAKSWKFDERGPGVIEIPGKKKRVLFDYDMETFLKGAEEWVN